MNPNENYGYPITSEDPEAAGKSKKRLRLLIILAIVLVIAFVILAIFANRKPLAVVNTSPSLTTITTQAPSLKINFNMPLAAGSASVSSNPSIVTGSSISGSTLTLTLKARTMLTLHTYIITINDLRSTSGRKLVNKQISFDPKFAAPFVTGENSLINIGLTNQQISDINSYNSQLKPWAQTVSVDSSTIKHFMLNPSDPWSPWAVSFTESIDGTSYNVVGSFNNPQDIQVKITDAATNTQVLSAGTPGSV